MRVAALAFGVLAGLVASLILALGGLDVTPSLAASADRQAQAIRFGLFVIGNVGMFGAALALAAPLGGAILLLLGAAAWVGAALLLRHSVDLVLITPPALLLVAAILALIAHFRRPQIDELEPDVEIISPARGERGRAANPLESDDGVSIPAFAAESRAARSPPLRGMDEDDQIRGNGDDDWNPRKRRPPPPRTKPAFRQFDEDEDDEPSGFSRFALSVSGLLSFGLYAALAGAAVLIFWSARTVDTGGPAAAALDLPISSSSAPAAIPSSELVLAPVLPSSVEPAPSSAEPPAIRIVEPASDTAASSASAAASPSSEEDFGDVIMPTDLTAPPRLPDDTGLPFDEATISSAEPAAAPLDLEPSQEPPAELEDPPQPTDAASVGPLMPFPMTSQMAALRAVPGTGPRRPAPAQPSDSGI